MSLKMVLMDFPDKNILVFEISSLKIVTFYIEKIQMAENVDLWPPNLTVPRCAQCGGNVELFSIFLEPKGPESLGKVIPR